MNVSRPGPFSVLMWLLFSLLFSVVAHANNFSILIDQDRNTASGCNVPLAGGGAPVLGAEVRLDVVVDSTAPVTVTTVRRALCDTATSTFSTPTTLPADLPVGLNLGVDASDVVEFDAPLADLGLTPGASVTLTVTSTTGQTGSVQATVTDLAIPGGTPPVVPANIPTLSDLGLVVMMALLAVVLWRQRHRSGWVAAVALLALPLLVLAVNHVSDGLIGDWTGETPIATHPAGQAPTPRTDVRQVFIAQENGQFFVRLDVTELERTPPALTVRASGPRRIVEGQTASLQATVANANGAVTYRWQQVSGTPVPLSTPNAAANPTFIVKQFLDSLENCR